MNYSKSKTGLVCWFCNLLRSWATKLDGIMYVPSGSILQKEIIIDRSVLERFKINIEIPMNEFMSSHAHADGMSIQEYARRRFSNELADELRNGEHLADRLFMQEHFDHVRRSMFVMFNFWVERPELKIAKSEFRRDHHLAEEINIIPYIP